MTTHTDDNDDDTVLLSERRAGVLRLTLNRPRRRNALSPALYAAFMAALDVADRDRTIGALVIGGAGGAFCAGGDVGRMAGTSEAIDDDRRVARLVERATGICVRLHEMDKPSIAMLRGPAVGAGFSIALACDLRIGDTTARMKTGFLEVAVPGDFGGHWFLPRLVGAAIARELYLVPSMLDAQTCLRLGLIGRIVHPEALESETMTIAQAWADGPREAIALTKRNLNLGLRASLAEVVAAEAQHHVRATSRADHHEAARAFVEKRRPTFSGAAASRAGGDSNLETST